MTAKQRKTRRSAIIVELSRLSRDGWQHAKPCDYIPLEKELAGSYLTDEGKER